MAAETSAQEHDALLPSQHATTSYESFPHPRGAREPADSRDEVHSEDGSYTDAHSYVSSDTTGSTLASKTRSWLSIRLQRGQGWFDYAMTQHKSFHRRYVDRYLRNAVAVIMMGIAAAVVACIVDVGESRIFDWKYGICTVKWTANTDCPAWQTWSEVAGVSDSKLSAFNFAIYLALVLLLATLSHVWTRCTRAHQQRRSSSAFHRDAGKEVSHVYYAAAGSGVLDVKQAISGAQEEAPWTISTLVMKTLGLIMSTSSGLSVGKEGPYVHLAASAANLVNTSVPAGLRISSRKALSIGSAAGMAAAFGTPLTGAMFVMEDFGQSLTTSFFTILLGGGVIAVVALTGFNPYGRNKVVPWEVRYSTSGSPNELGLFLALGIAAGVLAALFTGGVRLWSRYYRQISLVKRYPTLDVLLVALVTACSSFWATYLRFGTAELLSGLTRETKPAQEAAQGLGSLGASLVVKSILTIVTFGLQIPQGVYMPSMAMGALLGRFVGQSALALLTGRTLFGYGVSPNPAVYAMAGAGAVMAGITRLQLSIVVLVFETTQSWEYLFQFAVSIYTAKMVASILEPQGIYDLVADLHGQPSLETVLSASDARVEDVWEPQAPCTPSLNLVSSFVANVHSVRMLLDASEIAGSHHLPILKQKLFVGCISNQSLGEALQQLDDSSRIDLAQNTSDTLRMCIVRGDATNNAASDLVMDTDQIPGPVTMLPLHHPAVFESCSTLSSIHAYFKESDADYICVTRHGTSWTVVTRQILAEWSMSVLQLRASSRSLASNSSS